MAEFDAEDVERAVDELATRAFFDVFAGGSFKDSTLVESFRRLREEDNDD